MSEQRVVAAAAVRLFAQGRVPAETVRGGAVAEAFAGAEVEHCFACGALNRSERSIEFGGFLVGSCECVCCI